MVVGRSARSDVSDIEQLESGQPQGGGGDGVLSLSRAIMGVVDNVNDIEAQQRLHAALGNISENDLFTFFTLIEG